MPRPETNLNPKLVNELHEIGGWIQDACGDMARDAASDKYMLSEYKHLMKDFDPNIKSVERIAECLADSMYGDLDTISGLCGDRICDAMMLAGYRWNDEDFTDAWNEAVDYFTTNVVRHISGLNEDLKR